MKGYYFDKKQATTQAPCDLASSHTPILNIKIQIINVSKKKEKGAACWERKCLDKVDKRQALDSKV